MMMVQIETPEKLSTGALSFVRSKQQCTDLYQFHWKCPHSDLMDSLGI